MKTHTPVPGAFMICGVPACTCGYRHKTRYGSKARAKLHKHLRKEHATVPPTA